MQKDITLLVCRRISYAYKKFEFALLYIYVLCNTGGVSAGRYINFIFNDQNFFWKQLIPEKQQDKTGDKRMTNRKRNLATRFCLCDVNLKEEKEKKAVNLGDNVF